MTKFFKKVSKLVKCLCQVGAFLLESSGRLNDLLHLLKPLLLALEIEELWDTG